MIFTAQVSTSSGLGFYATKALASKGAQCVITVRNVEKGEAVKADLEAPRVNLKGHEGQFHCQFQS